MGVCAFTIFIIIKYFSEVIMEHFRKKKQKEMAVEVIDEPPAAESQVTEPEQETTVEPAEIKTPEPVLMESDEIK